MGNSRKMEIFCLPSLTILNLGKFCKIDKFCANIKNILWKLEGSNINQNFMKTLICRKVFRTFKKISELF